MKNKTVIPPEFNPATYMVIDKVSGEEVDVRIFVESVNKNKWEKAFTKTLAEYIGAGGTSSGDVLAYIIKNHNAQNLILATFREIAIDCECSTTIVQRVFNALYKKRLIKKVRDGCYFLSPNVISYGKKLNGAMLLRLWID